MSPAAPVTVVRESYGPIERLVFTPVDPPKGASMSVFRIGDTVIDTGGSRVTDAVLDTLAERPIRRILLTHQHEDHVGNLGPIFARFGALPVHAPRALLHFLPSFRTVPPYRHVYWGPPHPLPTEPLLGYDDGDRFDLDAVAIEAMHTPGHTPPHHVFVVRDAGSTYVIAGDLYSSKPLDAFLESAVDDTILSYRRVASLEGELTLLPTHGWVRPDARALLNDAADWLAREAEAIETDALALGTRDPIRIAESRYGHDRTMRISQGEMGPSVFVRSVLDPVRALPASPISS